MGPVHGPLSLLYSHIIEKLRAPTFACVGFHYVSICPCCAHVFAHNLFKSLESWKISLLDVFVNVSANIVHAERVCHAVHVGVTTFIIRASCHSRVVLLVPTATSAWHQLKKFSLLELNWLVISQGMQLY